MRRGVSLPLETCPIEIIIIRDNYNLQHNVGEFQSDQSHAALCTRETVMEEIESDYSLHLVNWGEGIIAGGHRAGLCAAPTCCDSE